MLALRNELLERHISIADGPVRTVQIMDRSGRRLLIHSDEFRLAVSGHRTLTSDDFELVEHSVEHPDGGVLLRLGLRARAAPLHVELAYTLGDADFYGRKWLTVSAAGEAKWMVYEVTVEQFVSDQVVELGGFGRPLLIGNAWFAGLEYPGGHNQHDGRRVALRHYPGRPIGSQPLRSKVAVVGALPGRPGGDGFAAYLDRTRIPPRPFVVYNSWYDLQSSDRSQRDVLIGDEVTDGNMSRSVRELLTELTERRGVKLDSVILDSGWQETKAVWAADPRKFPQGLRPLSQLCRDLGSHLGIWASLTPNDRLLDLQWGDEQGYEVSRLADFYERHHGTTRARFWRPRSFYCLSGPRYHAALREAITTMVRGVGVNYFKFDFNHFDCSTPGHGHLPVERYGVEANVDAALAILRFARELDPSIYLHVTGGLWLSPWWLHAAETIFAGRWGPETDGFWHRYMGDYGYERSVFALSPRDWDLTHRDSVLYRDIKQDRWQFPVTAVMTIGIIYGHHNLLGGTDEPSDRWLHNVVFNFGRGSALQELYISPALLSESHWNWLAAGTRWFRDRALTLLQGEMILGQPDEGEAYGFSHAGDGRAVFALRNPAGHARILSLEIPQALEFGGYVAEVVYPYRLTLSIDSAPGDSLSVTLGPWEVAIVELTRATAIRRPLLLGCRYAIEELGESGIRYRLFPPAGGTVSVRSPVGCQVMLDNLTFSVLANVEQPLPQEILRRTARSAGIGERTHGRVTTRHDHSVVVDYGLAQGAVESVLVVLVESADGSLGEVQVVADGQIMHAEGVKGEGWTGFCIPLLSRAGQVECRLMGAPEEERAVSCWLVCHDRLPALDLIALGTFPGADEALLPTPFAHRLPSVLQLERR